LSKNYKIILGVVAVYAVVYYLWMQKKKGGQVINMQLAERIKAGGKYKGDVNVLASLDTDYLKAWHDAMVAGQLFFMVGGRKYNVQGGKSIA